MKTAFNPVKTDISFPEQELDILTLWEKKGIFNKTLDREGPIYNFYDGPPFATGLPHYGHLLQGIVKDVIPRYWTMKGYRIPRRFGWDCHGLPVEYEVNKELGLHSRRAILDYGVARYNEACQGIVMRHSSSWKKAVRRVGRWVDMENPYYTMDASFMQSVWYVFKSLYEKGLIYRGYKVVPFSTGVSTPLSNFEANLNYKEIQDPAITVTFPLCDGSGSVLAWTTTPWTLPSNLALAVHPNMIYVLVEDKKEGGRYWLGEPLLENFFDSEDVTVIEKTSGKNLVGREYKPLFTYFSEQTANGAFRVIASDHVSADSGTGVVHMAPAFGEDDFYAMAKTGIPVVNPVNDDGCFDDQVPDYAGMKVKEADSQIIKDLKLKKRLFRQDTIEHSYPFCYRSDEYIIYKAVASWFVAVEKIKDELVAANKTTHWVPEGLRDGRFGNWLENSRDWAISRNRFWGNPIPIWRNDEGEEICVGSIEELESLSGHKVKDLHKQYVDEIEIPSSKGGKPLRRVEDVLDCWFESASMPYAQWGYPFHNKDFFEKAFPADFISEGLDQTRGWFYTLMVIGVAFYGRAPFKNVIVNGLILAEDGRKMSKSLRNYPDPEKILQDYGADALRLYLLDSPVLKAEEVRFQEKGVRDIVRRILLRWWNAYGFFTNYARIDAFKPKGDFLNSPNLLDKFILSKLNGLLAKTQAEMEGYRLYGVVPELLSFIETLTNTYIRFNRSHFWEEGMSERKRMAFETLYHVLETLARAMAPFAPFLAEETYQNLCKVREKAPESVHLCSYPEPDQSFQQPQLEQAVERMETLVTMARNFREKVKVRAKIPFNRMCVIHREKRVLDELKSLENYFSEEINVKSVEYLTNERDFIEIAAKAVFPVLGRRLGPKMKVVAQAIADLSENEILAFETQGTCEVQGEVLKKGDIEIIRRIRSGVENVMVDQRISFQMDPTVTRDQEVEGLFREVLRRVQLARRTAGLNFDDRILLFLSLDSELREAVERHRESLMKEALVVKLDIVSKGAMSGEHTETVNIDSKVLVIGLTCFREFERENL